MRRFRLSRPGQLDLVFDGELLAEVASKDEPDQPRWTEIRVYKTATDKYVTELVGKSVVPGERDRININVAETPHAVIDGLHRTRPSDGLRYLTKLGLEALDEAAERDPSLGPQIVEAI
jgi:hypothetical protein